MSTNDPYDELQIAERVSAGITTLDTYIPTWRNAIDLDQLNISSGDSCILGQVAAEFEVGKDILPTGLPGNGFIRASEVLARADGAIDAPADDDYSTYYGDSPHADARLNWAREHGFVERDIHEDEVNYEETDMLQDEWLRRLQED